MLRIYHTSDIHHHLGFAPALAAIRAAQPGMLIDCGDSLRGSQTVYYRNEPVIAEMNAAGYDLGVPGNREFHYLHSLMRTRLEKMNRPLICANLVDTFRRPLPFVKDFTLLFDGERRVRFFGLIVEQYPLGSPWERFFGWRFLNPFAVAREVAASIASDEVLILLSHLGLRMDRRIAEEVPRIDLILGGHSHDTLHEPEEVGGVRIVHAGPYARFVSATEIAFDTGDARARVVRSALLPLR
jgi:2',3'-cyclic-nucleotide 2'-phosphodiesterase (5'-nucleotidase family)